MGINAVNQNVMSHNFYKNDAKINKVANFADVAVTAGATLAVMANGLNQDKVELKEDKNSVSIDPVRAFTGILTDEQIDNINKNKKLAKGAVFQKNENGDFDIKNDLFGTTKGTRTLPDGYEIKKNIFGIAKVVPVGTKDIFMNE